MSTGLDTSLNAESDDIFEMLNQTTRLRTAEKDLTSQRNQMTTQLDSTTARKRELTITLSTLRASYDAELRINEELQEDLQRENER